MSTSTVLVRRIAALFLGASLALSLSACGSDESSGSASAAGDADAPVVQETSAAEPSPEPADASGNLPDPCTWLTASDVESIVGVTFLEGEANADLSTDFQNICEWWAADGSIQFVQVLVTDGAASVSVQRESAEGFMGETVDVTVAGASDAYTVAEGSILGMAVGDHFVQVSLMSSSMDDVTSTTVALAERVAGNA